MISAAEAPVQYAAAAPAGSGGVWAAAWRRLRNDRVGMSCLGIVGAFAVLVLLASFGLVAGDWQQERGVIYAPPDFVGPDTGHRDHVIDEPSGPRADLSDVDPLAPRYAEWRERTARFQTVETPGPRPCRWARTGWVATCSQRPPRARKSRSSSGFPRRCSPR